ncbi:MAG: hypothetical protein ACI310_01795 [Bacilli bacterium]
MKLNKKGFMLAEVVVSASVIAVILVTLYIGLNRMTSAYETRNRYYDIDAQQVAMEVNDALIRSGCLDSVKSSANTSSDYIYNMSDEFADDYQGFPEQLKENFGYNDIKVFFSLYDDDNLGELKGVYTSVSFGNYIDYLLNKIDFNESYSYFIVVELQKKDVNDCYYYTLKVK